MKKIEYVIESSKIDEDKNIAICSDMHINIKTPAKKIDEVLQTLTDIKPTHIVIPGDLYDVDDTTMFDMPDRVSLFIDNATDIADVFYVKGNIEQKSGLLPYKLYNNTNPKFHLLCESNSDGKYRYIENGGINIAGIKPPLDFYKLSESERANFLLLQYRKYLERLSKYCGSKNFNVLLCHDPIIARTMLYLENLANNTKYETNLNFDLIISGHNHGGIWPNWMRPLFKLIGANMELCYPTYTNGMIDIGRNGEKIIISEGITKFHSDFGKLQSLEKYHEGTVENVKVLSRKNNIIV